jgi:glycosidase
MKKNILKNLTALMTVTSVTAILLAGCTGKQVAGDAEGQEGTEQTEPKPEIDYSDPLLSAGKQKEDTAKKEVEIPDDYEYSLDEMGFLDIGEINEPTDDNFRNYYEIFVLSYYDSDGDGIGDINGVTEKLDYIKEMGFNGIWLMPIMASPSYHKYDTTDYYLIDPAYGTNEDFRNLLKEAHDRDIKIIIDFVINHSSSEHPWFTQACDYLRTLKDGEEPDPSACPYVDYYNFRKDWTNGYCKVEGTDWYYEGVFNYTQPDLNFDNPDLVKEIDDAARFWAELGVDGLRVDAAAHFKEGDAQYNKDVLTHLYETCTAVNPDFYMVSEVWLDEVTVSNYYESMTPSFFNFDSGDSTGRLIKTAGGISKASSFAKAMLRYQEDYGSKNPDYIDAVFITNHDQSRVANALKNDPDDMKKACGLMMTMQGSTFVYYGEEIGMKSSGNSDENKRLPFIWSEEDETGKTNGPEKGEKSVKSNFAACDKQASDPDSILNYYRRAVNFRNEFPEIARGTISFDEADLTDTTALVCKEYEGSKIYIAFNTADESGELSVPAGLSVVDALTLHPWEGVELNDGKLSLPAGAIVVLK